MTLRFAITLICRVFRLHNKAVSKDEVEAHLRVDRYNDRNVFTYEVDKRKVLIRAFSIGQIEFESNVDGVVKNGKLFED